MDRRKARALWSETFLEQSAKDRSAVLKRLLAGSVKDVIQLASVGRRRYDLDQADRGVYLLARSRRKNTLLDVVEIRFRQGRRGPKLESINLYSEMTLGLFPGGMFVECRSTGNSHGFWLGKGAYKGYPGTAAYIPELHRAIPRLESYRAFGSEVRCIWTASQALNEFDKWLKRYGTATGENRSQSIVTFFNQVGFHLSDEAGAAIRESDAATCREASSAVAGAVNEPDRNSDAIARGLMDPDREVRRSAICWLRSYDPRLEASHIDVLRPIVRTLLQKETDDEIVAIASEWFVRRVPVRDEGIDELIALTTPGIPSLVRKLAIRRLGIAGRRNPKAEQTVLEVFDEFPIEATDALIHLKVFSPRAKAKVGRLLRDRDWSKRWRAVTFVGECPSVSKDMAGDVKRLLDDEEYTVRTEAERVAQRLKRKGAFSRRRRGPAA